MQITTKGARETFRLGERLAGLLRAGDVILLSGELGAGKTTLAAGVGSGLGIEEPVTSPTFTIVQEYRGRLPLYHLDAYRLAGEGELADLGLEEYLPGDGITLVEWPQRIARLLPPHYLLVELSRAGAEERVISLTPRGKRYQRLLEELAYAITGTG